MKLNCIINRYILRRMAGPFLINVGFFTFMFLMSQILDIMRLVVNYNASVSAVLLIIVYSIPYFLVFIIPLSVMMSVLLAFLRMSADNEITALKAGGVSIFHLTPPVLCFCMTGVLLTAVMTFYGLPWGEKSLDGVIAEAASSSMEIGLKERNFNDDFDGVMLYVTNIDIKTKTLVDVFIEDQRNPDISSTVVAPRGKLFSDPEKKVFQLRLFNGVVNQVSLKNRSAHSLKFETYDLKLDLKKNASEIRSGSTDEKAMWFSELREHIEKLPAKNGKYYEALVELHKKFAMPAACLVLGMLAFPLGLQSGKARRSFGLGLGLFFFLLFYLMLSAGKAYGESGQIPPAMGLWAPNAIIAVVAVHFLKRAGAERPFTFRFLPEWIRGRLIEN